MKPAWPPCRHCFSSSVSHESALVLVGDFFQFPPIAEAASSAARQWLARDIYAVAAVRHGQDVRVAALDIQYRIHPDIARVAERLYRAAGLVYRTAPGVGTYRASAARTGPAPGQALVFVDTMTAHPRTERDRKGSAGNDHVELIMQLARRTATESPGTSIAVIAPFRHQVRLLREAAHEGRLDGSVRIGTIHQFQGQQSDVVIFDTTVTGDLSHTMLGRSEHARYAWRLVNVALTRAKSKLIVVGHRAALATLVPLPKTPLWDCVR